MNLEGMIQTLRQEPYSITDERVLEAMQRVPREAFVPEDWKHAAYDDRSLPIGHEQTISQPYIVALMTQMLDPQPEDRILEIGSGCGYQTAILAQLAQHVYAVEIVGELAERSRGILSDLGITNVSIRHGDGVSAWQEEAPFDRLLAACAPQQLPDQLRNQLVDGGRMVYPAGEMGSQFLYRLDRQGDIWRTEKQLEVRFVPMTYEVR